MNPVGIKERLHLATTFSEVNALLAEASTFKEVSKKTKKAWDRVVGAKTRELEGGKNVKA